MQIKIKKEVLLHNSQKGYSRNKTLARKWRSSKLYIAEGVIKCYSHSGKNLSVSEDPYYAIIIWTIWTFIPEKSKLKMFTQRLYKVTYNGLFIATKPIPTPKISEHLNALALPDHYSAVQRNEVLDCTCSSQMILQRRGRKWDKPKAHAVCYFMSTGSLNTKLWEWRTFTTVWGAMEVGWKRAL